jgi:hypothetical protein
MIPLKRDCAIGFGIGFGGRTNLNACNRELYNQNQSIFRGYSLFLRPKRRGEESFGCGNGRMFVSRLEDFKGVFERAMSALDNGVRNFAKKMRE